MVVSAVGPVFRLMLLVSISEMASLDIFACNTRGCLFYQVGVGSGKI